MPALPSPSEAGAKELATIDAEAGLGAQFWINILLTLLGGLPGTVHALWLVARDKK